MAIHRIDESKGSVSTPVLVDMYVHWNRYNWNPYLAVLAGAVVLFFLLLLLMLLLLYPFVSVVYKVYKTLSDCKQYRRFNIARSLTRLYSTWLDDWISQFHSILQLPAETSNKQTTRWARRVPGTNQQAAHRWEYTTARYFVLIWRARWNSKKGNTFHALVLWSNNNK